ncbi:MAG TPA: response regulator transcription factor [Gaiellaceae bacterium]|nr:response regulator transcription factor [Gaiellaceae bacterium]
MKVEHRQILERVRPARRVLVVDDHASFRSCARTLLESEGFDVVGEAADGESAVTLASELEPELVLLDIQLPDLDGFEVAARLLAREPTLSIVLVSSRDEAAYGSRIQASGALGFVTKGDLSGVALERFLP